MSPIKSMTIKIKYIIHDDLDGTTLKKPLNYTKQSSLHLTKKCNGNRKYILSIEKLYIFYFIY